ncbi:MAG TPA: 16S rRNA (uracil(1498)-N(3))-methyltransferase [Steroidobacteraceae bacterium]|nr:16S rRNA (uracil(1498)-N(3))-methyltransferase [Steroidobacteraceae bacterium]
MRLTRVYVDAAPASGARLTLQGSAATHIARVLRLSSGDALTIFDGRGGEYAARIAELRKDAVRVEVGEHLEIERESSLSVTLAQGVSRGERMDFVVQKATELGVRRIVPVATERSVVRIDAGQAVDKRLRHWRAIAIAACEQCGRNRLPEIAPPQPLATCLGGLAPQTLRILLSLEGGSACELPAAADVTLLIGPEGGLTEEEQRRARAAGFVAVRLGPRVLRTETAALAALAVLQQRLGDL